MKYHKKRKTKCTRCKKLKTESCFNDVDYFWGVFRKSNWCKICDTWMGKQRDKENNKWLKNQAKIRQEIKEGRLKLTSDGRFIKPKRGERFTYIPL